MDILTTMRRRVLKTYELECSTPCPHPSEHQVDVAVPAILTPHKIKPGILRTKRVRYNVSVDAPFPCLALPSAQGHWQVADATSPLPRPSLDAECQVDCCLPDGDDDGDRGSFPTFHTQKDTGCMGQGAWGVRNETLGTSNAAESAQAAHTLSKQHSWPIECKTTLKSQAGSRQLQNGGRCKRARSEPPGAAQMVGDAMQPTPLNSTNQWCSMQGHLQSAVMFPLSTECARTMPLIKAKWRGQRSMPIAIQSPAPFLPASNVQGVKPPKSFITPQPRTPLMPTTNRLATPVNLDPFTSVLPQPHRPPPYSAPPPPPSAVCNSELRPPLPTTKPPLKFTHPPPPPLFMGYRPRQAWPCWLPMPPSAAPTPWPGSDEALMLGIKPAPTPNPTNCSSNAVDPRTGAAGYGGGRRRGGRGRTTPTPLTFPSRPEHSKRWAPLRVQHTRALHSTGTRSRSTGRPVQTNEGTVTPQSATGRHPPSVSVASTEGAEEGEGAGMAGREVPPGLSTVASAGSVAIGAPGRALKAAPRGGCVRWVMMVM